MTTASPSKTASEIMATAGVKEDTSYYGSYTDERQKVVLTVPMRIQAAWKANDADTFADLFAENGSLLMQDDQLTSREQIRSYMAEGFQGQYRGAYVKGWPIELKFIDDDVAMVITEGGIILPGEDGIAPERMIRATWVISRQKGDWKLFSHQSSPVKG
jgi:uncharacterized protein (TIGR02246 family)